MTLVDFLALPSVRADHRLAYGPEASQFGDLYLPPTGGPHPVAIVIHGGCWRTRYDLAPMSGLCAALARSGRAAWSIEYRRLEDGGGWPGTFLDVAAAADHLRTLAPRMGLDLTRVIALGHSAGGHLALWLAARQSASAPRALGGDDPLRLRGAIGLAPLADLEAAARRGLCGGACAQLIEQVPEPRGQASPAGLASDVPQWHVVAEADELVPADYGRAALERARRHGEAHLEVVPGVGHFELVVPAGPAWAALGRALAALDSGSSRGIGADGGN